MLGTCPIQRQFGDDQVNFVRRSSLFRQMKEGIDKGDILPALRKNEVHFYEGGARLFRFTVSKIFSHSVYIDSNGDKELEIRDPEAVSVSGLRERAVQHRREKQPDSELAAVHALFPHFAITRNAHKSSELALIDVEARFSEDTEASPKLTARMIDLVFLTPRGRLLFIEAKCLGNPEVVSTKTPKVVEQVRDYQRHIAREGVLEALNRSLELQAHLVERPASKATAIYPNVPILVLDPTRKGRSPRSKDTFLRDAFSRSEQLEAHPTDIMVIDGTLDSANAIRSFVERRRL